MSHDAINSWVENAKNGSRPAVASSNQGVQVVKAKQPPKDLGSLILEVAERIFPSISKMLEGVRDNNGMLLQPAHIRAISLDVAQGVVKKQVG